MNSEDSARLAEEELRIQRTVMCRTILILYFCSFELFDYFFVAL